MRRKRWSLGALSLLLILLTGCGALLNRSYSAEKAHSPFSDEDKGTNVLRADGYQGLVSALLHLISNGQESGVIRLYDYSGPAEQDVDKACLEVTRQDPLGAYAVDYIKYDMARPATYYEVDVKVIYQRSWQQISAVSSVTGSSALLGELRTALGDFQKEKVLRVSYFEAGMSAQSVIDMVDEAYYDVPEATFGKPEVQVTLYPEEAVQQQRLVEILLEYPASREDLKAQQSQLLERVSEVIEPLEGGTAEEVFAGCLNVLEGIALDRQGAATAYAAVMDGSANEEGRSLAMELLLQKSGLQCRMVRGTCHGTKGIWVAVQLGDFWQHIDPNAPTPRAMGDTAMMEAGYRWSGDIPSCRDLPRDG